MANIKHKLPGSDPSTWRGDSNGDGDGVSCPPSDRAETQVPTVKDKEESSTSRLYFQQSHAFAYPSNFVHIYLNFFTN